MNREKLRENAKALRRKRKTYSEIQKELGVSIPKSTLSYWCRNILLPASYFQIIKSLNLKNLNKARTLAVLANKEKQEKILTALRKKNEYLARYLNKDICKLLLSMLYLGEGAKHKGSRALKLGSTDPKIIQLYLKLLYKCFPITSKKFRVAIGCRADQNIRELEKYWHSITEIPYSQFYKTQIDKRTVGKKTKKKDYKGVCLITYFDTRIQLELEQVAQQIIEWIR